MPPLSGWNASDVEFWFAGIVKNGLVDRTVSFLRTTLASTLSLASESRDVDARLRSLSPSHVVFLASLCVCEMEKAASGDVSSVFQYLKAACRPESAAAGQVSWRLPRCAMLPCRACRVLSYVCRYFDAPCPFQTTLR